MKLRFIAPLIIFCIMVIILWKGLSLHPTEVPSPLVGKPAPEFQLPTLFNPANISLTSDLKHHVTLLNVWASWCIACADEHELLMKISKNKSFVLVGLDYKDNPDDAKKWLSDKGNPYQLVVMDKQGQTAIDWGVYGTPETFVIDKKGIIRFKQIGPINDDNWQQIFLPLIAKLESEQ
jgi:cytochrome c biogenesis protein CcmG/thiol:disulfide interchange protein DsbE